MGCLAGVIVCHTYLELLHHLLQMLSAGIRQLLLL